MQGKVVVISGGAGLLGREFARAGLAQGAIVVLADRDLRGAVRAARALNRRLRTTNAVGLRLDITSAVSIDRLIAAVRRRFGRVDALVNAAYPRNARYGRDLFAVRYQDFCENLNMHLGGYFLASQRFARFFLKQGSGNIVNVASVYGVIAPRFELYKGLRMEMPVEYAAIKAGLLHLTRYFAKRLKGSNIRVNAISPGGIEDGQDRRFLQRYRKYCLSKGVLAAADIGGALVFLLSDASRYVNGQNIIVDDGFSL
jgi:NAD(P)-dependent dehydrogenase (short-subunit alcohol dehydrogenase family)